MWDARDLLVVGTSASSTQKYISLPRLGLGLACDFKLNLGNPLGPAQGPELYKPQLGCYLGISTTSSSTSSFYII
jgi:hypothetical protein